MNADRREQVRLSLLRYCEAASPFGMAGAMLLQFIRNEGFRTLALEQCEAEILYLADKGLLAPVPKLVSPENPAWRITAAGRDFLAAGRMEYT
jgi:hypothetical protein